MAQNQLQHTTPLSCATFNQKTHGRVVQRQCQVFRVPQIAKKTWSGLQAFVVVERVDMRDGKPFNERHFYISSQILDATLLLNDVIGHWGIENRLHWIKDVTFREDFPLRRGGNAPVNWAILHSFFITNARFFGLVNYSPSSTGFIKSTRTSFFSACMKPPCSP